MFAIFGTFFWASANIIDKILRTKYLKSSTTLTASFGIFGMIFSFILFMLMGVPNVTFPYSLAAFMAGVIVPYLAMPYLKSLSLEEASRVVPLWHLSPIFTLVLAALFLNEILTQSRYVAFAVILLGGIVISTKKMGNMFHLSPAVALMLFSSFLVAIVDVLMKFAFGSGIFWEIIFLFYLGGSLSNLSLFVLPKVRRNFLKSLRSKTRNFPILLFFSTLLGFLGFVSFYYAVSTAPVTLVSVFVSFQSFFVLLIATFLSVKFPFLIKEAIDMKTIGTKLFAIGLMAFGILLLSF